MEKIDTTNAHRLTPFAQTLAGYGDTPFVQNADLRNTGILNIHADLDTLARQFVNAMLAVDPNRYAANSAQTRHDADAAHTSVMSRQLEQASAAALAGAKKAVRALNGMPDFLADY